MEYRGRLRGRTDKLTIDQLLPQNVGALRVTFTMTAMAHLWVAPVPCDKNLRAGRRRVRTMPAPVWDLPAPDDEIFRFPRVPPPTPDGHEGRLFPPEHPTTKTFILAPQAKYSQTLWRQSLRLVMATRIIAGFVGRSGNRFRGSHRPHFTSPEVVETLSQSYGAGQLFDLRHDAVQLVD